MKYAVVKDTVVQKILGDENVAMTKNTLLAEGNASSNARDSYDQFMNYVQELNKDVIFLELTEDELKADQKHEEGMFMLHDPLNNFIKLVRKNKIVNKGYFYSTYQYTIDLITRWDMYKIEDDKVQDTPEPVIVSEADNEIDKEFDSLFAKTVTNIDTVKTVIETNNETANKIQYPTDNQNYINNLRPFSMEHIVQNPVISITGRNPEQKSETAMDIVDYLSTRDFIPEQDIYTFVENNTISSAWREKFSGATHISANFNDQIGQVITDQICAYKISKYCVDDQNNMCNFAQRCSHRQKIVVVHMSSINSLDMDILRTLIQNGRNYKLTIILIIDSDGHADNRANRANRTNTTSRCVFFPEIRNNFDYVIVQNVYNACYNPNINYEYMNDNDYYKFVHDFYGNVFPTMGSLRSNLQFYGSLIFPNKLINNRFNPGSITDRVFTY